MHVGSLVARRFTGDDVELLAARRAAGCACDRARAAHEQTRQFDQLKLNFVAIASHELRTPATSIYGALTTLVQRLELPPETREELIEMAYQQSDRMRRLIEQLLDLSRLDARAIAWRRGRSSSASVARRDRVRRRAAGVDVDVDVPPDLAVVADPLVLERILTNLLTNAVRHGAPPIRVTRCARTRACGYSSRTPAPACPRICGTGCSTASPVRTPESAAASASRSHAPTPRRRAASSSTATATPGARFELIVPQD